MATDDKSTTADACGGGGIVELPAPDGWKKKFTPKKSSRRHDILFISPTGEEIRSKSQLDRYLKSRPGGPSASEFDWSAGETPRRSGRISDKIKATEAPEIEPPSKRSSMKKGSRARKENKDIENKDIGNDEDTLVEKEDEKSEKVEQTDGGEATENNPQDAVVEEPMQQPVTEETVANDSEKEQADDHVDTPIEEITDGGTQNRLSEPDATPENEGVEVNAGLDVNVDESCVKVETQPAENPQPEIEVKVETQPAENPLPEIDVTGNTQAISNLELPGNDTMPEKGFSEDASK